MSKRPKYGPGRVRPRTHSWTAHRGRLNAGSPRPNNVLCLSTTCCLTRPSPGRGPPGFVPPGRGLGTYKASRQSKAHMHVFVYICATKANQGPLEYVLLSSLHLPHTAHLRTSSLPRRTGRIQLWILSVQKPKGSTKSEMCPTDKLLLYRSGIHVSKCSRCQVSFGPFVFAKRRAFRWGGEASRLLSKVGLVG